MMELKEALQVNHPLSEKAMALSSQRWDDIAKPLKSLGLLETTITKLAGISGSAKVDISKRCVAVMCADNGVVAQKVTQTDKEITAVMTESFAAGNTSVCCMAKHLHADIVPVDVGVARDLTVDGVLNRKIMYGTNDMTQMPAMSREQAVKALEVGIHLVEELKQQGYQLIMTGEMGIGNTTSSSAVTSVLLNLPPEQVTGHGAGLDQPGLLRKVSAIKTAISLNRPNPDDPVDVLAKVGGLDIAAMAGLYLGGMVYRIPVMIDGVISAVAALIAARLAPNSKDYMIPSHVSKEPAGKLLLDELGFRPLLTCDLCLGEGTGAVAALSVLDTALCVYHEMVTFSGLDISKYEEFDRT